MKNGGLKTAPNGIEGANPTAEPKDEEPTVQESKTEEIAEEHKAEIKNEDQSHDQKPEPSKKRKADDDDEPIESLPSSKRTKEEPTVEKLSNGTTVGDDLEKTTNVTTPAPKHKSLPKPIPTESFSLFAIEDFHEQLCRCADCFPKLVPHPQLREAEETYEPPVSEDGDADGAASAGTGSIYDRGEAALNSVDRVRAIEGAMAYNHLRDNLKVFLKPFAESGQAVSAEDIKGIFEKLRGDEKGIQDAADHASGNTNDKDGDASSRNEQSGM
jgi:E3 ubiquitin-protein ligase UBR7